jgi:hypothetical protein
MSFADFVLSILAHWGALMTGGAIIAFLGLWERWRSKPLSWALYKWIAVLFVLFAVFLAWNDEHSKVIALTKRDPIKQQLRMFYAEGEKLAEGPPSREQGAYKKYQADIRAWQAKVVKWLDEDMALGASSKFKEYRTHLPTGGYEGADQQEIWDRNYISALCANLDEMIKSDAWDKPQ